MNNFYNPLNKIVTSLHITIYFYILFQSCCVKNIFPTILRVSLATMVLKIRKHLRLGLESYGFRFALDFLQIPILRTFR